MGYYYIQYMLVHSKKTFEISGKHAESWTELKITTLISSHLVQKGPLEGPKRERNI